MKLNRSQQHQQARELLKGGDVQEVTVDGKAVTAAEALEALREHDPLAEGEATGLAEKIDAFETKLAAFEVGIPGTDRRAKIGQWTLDALDLAPDESVKQLARVEITRADGERFSVDAESIDLSSSALLKRLSSVVSGVSALPLIGTPVGYGASALSAVVGVGAHALGKQQMGAALLRMSGKHLILSTVTMVPVAGSLACVLCAARDTRDHDKLMQSATVADTVNLAQYGKATLPPE